MSLKAKSKTYNTNLEKAKNEILKKEVHKTTVEIPMDMMNSLKHLAVDKNTSYIRLIREAINQYLLKYGNI